MLNVGLQILAVARGRIMTCRDVGYVNEPPAIAALRDGNGCFWSHLPNPRALFFFY